MATLEAEHIDWSKVTPDGNWLLQVHRHIDCNDASLVPINCDNQGTLSVITTGIIQTQTKDVNVYYNKSPDVHAQKTVDYSYHYTNENVADVLIKKLMKDKH